MSGNFKVLNGTPKSGKSLCLSCGNMARRVGQNMEDEIYCKSYTFENTLNASGSTRVPFKVAECTEYQPFNQSDLKSMEEMAWIIQVRKRGPAGFTGNKKGKDNKETLEIEIVPPKEHKHGSIFND